MFKPIKQFLSRQRNRTISPLIESLSSSSDSLSQLLAVQRSHHDFLLREQWNQAAKAAKNPLNRFGAKYFSQSDEDGITLEILRRIGIKTGTFAEIGVETGLENNTLILLAKGWRGFWIGAQDLCFNHKINPKRFAFFKAWVTAENITSLMQQGFQHFGQELDALSIDVDFNDYYFAQALLKAGVSPKLFIIEYNGKFPPPIKWIVKYDPNHAWEYTDYFGASLASFADLLGQFSYALVCCNAATGMNAFFVRNEYLSHFADVPKNIEDIFIGIQYQIFQRFGHPPSRKTIEQMLVNE
jgi:hypothetical protein